MDPYITIQQQQQHQLQLMQQQQQQQQLSMAKQLSVQQQYAQQLAKLNNPKTQNNSILPQIGTNSNNLPQISGINTLNSQNQGASKNTSIDMTVRSQMGMIPQVPKRRRKPRINYAQERLSRRNGQQNAEQVMKAYGIPKSFAPSSDNQKMPINMVNIQFNVNIFLFYSL